jgi:mannosyltransferase OCH1-like enzyme
MDSAHSTPIPKIIHYVWVGPGTMPRIVRTCIDSWKIHAKGYEFRFWNEQNTNMNHPYVRAMYQKGKWAFVSDYIRFAALESEGGIYLDTDMELLQSLDSFLENKAFVGRSNGGHVESSIIGATPHHPFIQAALTFYDTDKDFSINNTSPRVIEQVLATGTHPDVRVYGSEYFHPCDEGVSCDPALLVGAYARHHWAESWVPYAALRKFARRAGLMPFIKKFGKT